MMPHAITADADYFLSLPCCRRCFDADDAIDYAISCADADSALITPCRLHFRHITLIITPLFSADMIFIFLRFDYFSSSFIFSSLYLIAAAFADDADYFR